MTAGPAFSRLRQLATEGRPRPEPADSEVCDLCSVPMPGWHRHMVDVEKRRVICACRPCSILFDRNESGGSHYRLVPDRVRQVADLVLDNSSWNSLQVPVDMAFFFHSSAAERVVAFYPSPMGATESLLDLSTWQSLVGDNPVLAGLEPDVEALLADRTGDRHGYWLAPIDACYRLVALIRSHWKGLGGGPEVWREIERFFGELSYRAEPISRDSQIHREERAWA